LIDKDVHTTRAAKIVKKCEILYNCEQVISFMDDYNTLYMYDKYYNMLTFVGALILLAMAVLASTTAVLGKTYRMEHFDFHMTFSK
jgi:hypothetical protein